MALEPRWLVSQFALLRDEHAVLTVSSLVPQSMELGEVSLSLPTIITRMAWLAFCPSRSTRRRNKHL
jgi:hypothetical protein